MIAIGFAALAVLVLVLAGCLYACENKCSQTQFALDTIDALYMGMCQENGELIKRLDWFEGSFANAEAYCEMLQHSHEQLIAKIERMQQQY